MPVHVGCLGGLQALCRWLGQELGDAPDQLLLVGDDVAGGGAQALRRGQYRLRLAVDGGGDVVEQLANAVLVERRLDDAVGGHLGTDLCQQRRQRFCGRRIDLGEQGIGRDRHRVHAGDQQLVGADVARLEIEGELELGLDGVEEAFQRRVDGRAQTTQTGAAVLERIEGIAELGRGHRAGVGDVDHRADADLGDGTVEADVERVDHTHVVKALQMKVIVDRLRLAREEGQRADGDDCQQHRQRIQQLAQQRAALFIGCHRLPPCLSCPPHLSRWAGSNRDGPAPQACYA